MKDTPGLCTLCGDRILSCGALAIDAAGEVHAYHAGCWDEHRAFVTALLDGARKQWRKQ